MLLIMRWLLWECDLRYRSVASSCASKNILLKSQNLIYKIQIWAGRFIVRKWTRFSRGWLGEFTLAGPSPWITASKRSNIEYAVTDRTWACLQLNNHIATHSVWGSRWVPPYNRISSLMANMTRSRARDPAINIEFDVTCWCSLLLLPMYVSNNRVRYVWARNDR